MSIVKSRNHKCKIIFFLWKDDINNWNTWKIREDLRKKVKNIKIILN